MPLALILLGPAALASAVDGAPAPLPQTSPEPVANPRVVEFDPSPDHNATIPGGQPAVERYDFEIYLVGASAPFHTVSLGKPAPQTDGRIRYDFSSQVVGWPLPGGIYEARVAAVGPNGRGRSDVSNAFTFGTGGCTYTLSSTSLSVGASGGAQSVTVTAPAGCAWTASTTTSWITLTTPSGSGNGTVSFTVAANTTTASRTGSVTIAGQTLTVTQAGVTCTYTVAPTSLSFAAAGGSATVSVTTAAGCTWSASTSAPWLALGSNGGSGPGTVVVTAGVNDTTASRSGSVAVAGRSITVSQAAPTPPAAPKNVRVVIGQ